MAEKRFDMDDSWHKEWLQSNPSDEEIKLFNRLCDLSDYFSDMLFEEGSSTYELIKCQSKSEDGSWQDDTIDLPDELTCFSYTFFKRKVESLRNNYDGYFDSKEQLLCISKECLDDDVILHEMIHLHEFVINGLPLFYHDTLLWALYTDLRKEIDNLDRIISSHAHILSGQKTYNKGGLHDILFLLKSLDLDIKMGYSLGTVFRYDLKEFLTE